MSSSEAGGATGRVVGGEAAALAGTSAGDAAALAGTSAERALLDMHFVSVVRGYEQLYMRDHPLYGDRLRRSDAWAEIGTIVNQPADVCKKRWTRMRANYFRSLERAKRSANEPELRPERPAHEKMMTFLDQTFLTKNDSYKKLAVHDSDKEASESENEIVDSSGDDYNSLSQTPAPASELQDSSEDDEDVDFFVQLGECVKDFPEAVRIHVKREAFRIVTDAEEMLYHRKLRTDLEMNTSE